MPTNYLDGVRGRSVRMALDRLADYPSPCAACMALTPKPEVRCESLRRWVLQTRLDASQKVGPSTDLLEELKRLRAEAQDLADSCLHPQL